jgi:hypothetical protein
MIMIKRVKPNGNFRRALQTGIIINQVICPLTWIVSVTSRKYRITALLSRRANMQHYSLSLLQSFYGEKRRASPNKEQKKEMILGHYRANPLASQTNQYAHSSWTKTDSKRSACLSSQRKNSVQNCLQDIYFGDAYSPS